MTCRYVLAMLFAIFSLMIARAPLSAQVRATTTTLSLGSATVTATVTASVTASATIIARPVRIIAADLSRVDGAASLPSQATLSARPCDPGTPRGCRLIVVDMP